ncbi:hypothetical protein B0F90DRAFT_1259600 [Multifurca ochricompacta]|uniref:Uncharacterized protein n=1 Tax=Multifurca ochricompacta TaxID=376703 RepID=A0AAD4M9D6_9AGAM|nr:hypothetical protein B0F90DRAFT_1259600 [Multifurca ochricompacta]
MFLFQSSQVPIMLCRDQPTPTLRQLKRHQSHHPSHFGSSDPNHLTFGSRLTSHLPISCLVFGEFHPSTHIDLTSSTHNSQLTFPSLPPSLPRSVLPARAATLPRISMCLTHRLSPYGMVSFYSSLSVSEVNTSTSHPPTIHPISTSRVSKLTFLT